MLIVLPSDPATHNAATYLVQHEVPHRVLPIPSDLGYKTAANLAIWLTPPVGPTVLTDLSAAGLVIMRVFRAYQPEQDAN